LGKKKRKKRSDQGVGIRLNAVIAVVIDMFRMTLRMRQFKIPLSPFTKGELNIERSGIIAQFTGKEPVGVKRSL
jgi:hypothetical protein